MSAKAKEALRAELKLAETATYAPPTLVPPKDEKKPDAEQFRCDYTDPEVLRVMRETVAQGLSDTEFWLFLQVCKSTRLNPFKREIWTFKTKGYKNKHGNWVEPRLQIMVGYNGYLTIATSHEAFDGLESDIVTDAKGNPIAAWAKVYRKDRKHPATAKVFMREYSTGENMWASKPCHMLLKVAESHAIRKAFPVEVGGTYTPEEMPAEYAAPTSPLPEPEAVSTVDWSGYEFMVRLPPKYDTEKGHARMAKRGYVKNEENGLWYGSEFIDELIFATEENPAFQHLTEEETEGSPEVEEP